MFSTALFGRYFDGPKSFHSIIYSEKDVIIPSIPGNLTVSPDPAHDGGSCGMSASVRKWMRDIQASAVDEPSRSRGDEDAVGTKALKSAAYKYGSESNTKNSRKKRDLPDTDRNRLCNMYIQTDKFLWDAIYEREKDEQRTREEILSIISTHIKAVTRIYGNHKFGDIVGIQFAVQRTTVM